MFTNILLHLVNDNLVHILCDNTLVGMKAFILKNDKTQQGADTLLPSFSK